MSEHQSDVTFATTYSEPTPEQPGSVFAPSGADLNEADICIQITWTRTDGLGEWRTHLTVKEAVELRAKLYVAICAAGAQGVPAA